VTIGALKADEVNQRLKNQGLAIDSGPFKFLIQSNIPDVWHNIHRLYADYPLAESRTDFIDFYVAITSHNSLRSIYHKQAQFFIDGQLVFTPSPIQHATAMLEWGMNWCVTSHIHSYLIVHAAVIEKNGYAAVFPAPPGSGKSTLCATLVQEGWRLLSDELTMINMENGHVVPLPRPISLKNQSIDIIRNRYPEAVFGVISSDTLKGSVCHLKPPVRSLEQHAEECPVGWIIFPQYKADSAIEVVKKTKGMAFMEIANNAFNYSLHGSRGFDVLTGVVDRADCYNFTYSRLDEAIDYFIDLEIPDEF